MHAAEDVRVFVRRLEQSIAEAVAGQRRVVLAYSGGLASTLVATIARKRCELECIVAGREGSADVNAANVAKAYLDYHVNRVLLDSATTRTICRRLAEVAPGLSRRSRDSLAPLYAVIEREQGRRVISGFGSPRVETEIAAFLRHANVAVPLHEAADRRPVPRALLRAAAASLGLPLDWISAPRRAPSVGAGIEKFLSNRQSGLD